jgi:predicted Zn-dependent peptidase/outer membrane lipoprotein-sorting protein
MILSMTRWTRTLSLLVAVTVAVWAAPPAAAQAPEAAIDTAEYNVQDLTYPDLRDFDIPDPQRVALDNGMTVFLLEDRELPQVNAVARIGVGSVYEPHEKRGLAAVTGTVMRTGGTAAMSPDSLNLVLENLGASVETNIGETSGSAFMSTLADHVDTVLPLFADVLRTPAFAEAKVQQAKSQQKSGISRRNDDARQIASREFDKVLYGADSPYARTPEYYTIDRITPQDLADFHAQYVQPSNVILSVWGDFDADAMKQRIREQFGDWEAPADFEPPTPPTPEARRASSVNVIQKSDVNQSTIFMGHPGEITRESEDYAAVTIMNQVLSGGFSSRLFQTVRKEMGLAYSVFGGYSAGYERPGRFFAGVFTKSGSTVEATNAVMSEVEGMRTTAPTDEELSLAKDSYLNSFVFNFDTEREVLGRLMTYEYYNYPPDFLQRTKDRIENVTSADVQRVAQSYLHPEEAHVLIVGNRSQFSDSLATLTEDGTVNEIDISIPTSPPSEQAPATAASQKAGREALMQAKETLGGAAFDALQSMRVTSSQAVETPQGTQTIESTLVVALPGKMRAEQTLPNGMQIVIADDGSTMTMKTPRGTQTAPPQMRRQAKGTLWRSLPYLMANLDHEQLSVQSQGPTTVEGTEYETVKVTPPAGNALTLYLDPETHRPARMDYTAMSRQGPQSQTDVYSDFQAHNGIQIPHTTVTYQNGQKQAETTVSAVAINGEVSPDTFSLGDASE